MARSLGISRATVGFVLNGTPGQTISAATTERVVAEARRLGYRPHTAARALASGRSNLILLVLPDWPIEFSLGQHIDEATHTLESNGYTLITHTLHEDSRSRPLWETLQPDVVVGLLPFSDALVRSMREAGVPRIVPDPDIIPEVQHSEEGARLQIEHLRSLGHERIGYVRSGNPRLQQLIDMRQATALEAAAEAGLSAPEVFTLAAPESSEDPPVRDWVGRGITGIAAFNDDVAAAVIGAAQRAGLAVPAELSVVGHDDTPIAAMIEPRITSVRLDATGLGQYLASLAITAVDGVSASPLQEGSAVSLVERASSAVAPKATRI
ncbi:LacI family DNA-binding transcriptional regulator [Microbacterium sp. 22303]|uniref:LacI family DNA-binding transcriptional regulator n=1 Tax=Microbacterium sp. 22303 TaxID=3453905 RepID=UPI003F84F209